MLTLQGVLQFSESDVNLDSIQNLVHDPEARTQVLRLHMQITDRLTTNAARLGTAYELGRALADTCNLSGGQVGDDLVRMFNRYRLENLYDWLGQLDELFPERAARAVARSLHLWESWLSKQ